MSNSGSVSGVSGAVCGDVATECSVVGVEVGAASCDAT